MFCGLRCDGLTEEMRDGGSIRYNQPLEIFWSTNVVDKVSENVIFKFEILRFERQCLVLEAFRTSVM